MLDGVFLSTISAVLAANALTFWFGFSAWKVTRVEKQGRDASEAGWNLVGLIIPPLVLFAGAYWLA